RPLRAARRPGGRRRPRAATRAGADCAAPRLWAHGVGGARMEHAVDPLLPPARRRPQKGMDPHAPHRRAIAPPRAGPVVEERPDLARALRTLGVWGAMSGPPIITTRGPRPRVFQFPRVTCVCHGHDLRESTVALLDRHPEFVPGPLRGDRASRSQHPESTTL